jgi:Uma2 family endonuclease
MLTPLIRQAHMLRRVRLFPFRRAEQIMGMPASSKRRWTTSDVRALMDESRPWPRYELISGELVVTPAPGFRHQIVVLELARILADYCDRERVGVVVTSPSDLELVAGTITQPDIFVVPFDVLPDDDSVPTWSVVTSLRLAVEVISPSSVRIDRVEKRELYLEAPVAEYWVVDVDARMIERWFKDRETPTVARDELTWRPGGATNPLRIDLPAFFAKVIAKVRRPT